MIAFSFFMYATATRYHRLGIKCPREMVSHRNNRDNWSGFKWTL